MKGNYKKILLALVFSSMMLITGLGSLTLSAVGTATKVDNGEVTIDKTAWATDLCRTYEVELLVSRDKVDKVVPADVVLVIDNSGSMEGARLAAVKVAANSFVDQLLGGGNPDDNRISLVRYSTEAHQVSGWTDDADALHTLINGLNATNYTNIQDGFSKAGILIDDAIANPVPARVASKAVVMMSDGAANRYYDGANLESTDTTPTSHTASTIAAYNAGQSLWGRATVFAVGLFNGMPAGEEAIAVDTLTKSVKAGMFYNAPDETGLLAIYNKIASHITNPPLESAIVTDKLGDNFELVSTPIGASYDPATRIITWDIGTIEQGIDAVLTYHVKLKGHIRGGMDLMTNEWAKLEYHIGDADTTTVNFPNPTVDAELASNINLTINKEIWDQYETVKPANDVDDNIEFPIKVVGVDISDLEIYNEEFMVSRNNPVMLMDLEPGTYTVTELGLAGYIGGAMEAIDLYYSCAVDAFELTLNNQELSTISVTAIKEWVDGPTVHPTIELQLYQNDVAYGDPVQLVNGETEITWTDLERNDEEMVAYVYTVKEVEAPENYMATYLMGGLTVVNTYVIPTIDVTATKVWSGGPTTHPTIQLQLLKDGKAFGEVVELKTGTVKYTWTKLDATDKLGKAHVYTVKEVAVPKDYDMTISKDGLTITNTHSAVLAAIVPDVPKTGINNNQMLFVILLIAGGAAVVVLSRIKRNEIK